MKRENRILGMYIVLVLLVISLVLIMSLVEPLIMLGTLIAMFCGGYGLRETLDGGSKE